LFVHKKQVYLFSAWDKADFLENCALLGYYAAYRSMAKRWLNSRPHFCLRCLPTLAEEVCEQLRPVGTRPPRFYGLYKLHNEGVPLRPIVSNIGAPTYKLSKYLAGLLSQLYGALVSM
jgi:hypothetical protein